MQPICTCTEELNSTNEMCHPCQDEMRAAFEEHMEIIGWERLMAATLDLTFTAKAAA